VPNQSKASVFSPFIMIAIAATSSILPATATGYLSLLSESSPQLKHFALTRLLEVVDTLWHEIAHALPELEALSEIQPSTPTETDMRHLAAAVASRVFYHLQERFDALRLAMESGDDYIHSIVVSQGKDAYADSLIGAAIDVYITLARQRVQESSTTDRGGHSHAHMDSLPDAGIRTGISALDSKKIQRLLEALIQRSYEEGNYKNALGIAVEARDTALLEQVLSEAQKRCVAMTPRSLHLPSSSLSTLYDVLCYAMEAVSSATTDDRLSTRFRHSVLDNVAQHFKALYEFLSSTSEGSLLGDEHSHGITYTHLIHTPLPTGTDRMRRFSNIRMKCVFRFVQIQQRLKATSGRGFYSRPAVIRSRLR
jgi:hypothetical protein